MRYLQTFLGRHTEDEVRAHYEAYIATQFTTDGRVDLSICVNAITAVAAELGVPATFTADEFYRTATVATTSAWRSPAHSREALPLPKKHSRKQERSPLWRTVGEPRVIGVRRADDKAELREKVLGSMPQWPWTTAVITALQPHPNDPDLAG
ncbi:muconolactone Delta-isomerase family protein [Streptomyces sp. NPDC057543]|uniref:muconolactone Delta-isomerase family protein n=1 Tax=Streptomyces sp. NPDC057543 TaxID=3346163 RepID=UPI003693092B